MISKRFTSNLINCCKILSLVSLGISTTSFSAEYEWNSTAPIKTPATNIDNGKRILFDVSHGGTEGNADWVIDGGFSDFADALVAEGYTVEEFRGVDLNNDGIIQFKDDYNVPANVGINEAIITFNAISHADVLVLAETNRPFTVDEYAALKQFVDAGKGIFFVADHYDADRNLNTWDATEVFNGYNRSDLSAYNLHTHYGDLRNPKIATSGWLAENFGIRFRFNAIDYKQGVSGIVDPNLVEGLTQGVSPILMAAGATLAITDQTLAKGLVYFSTTDTPVKWNHAKDAGLYFGGEDEGPYVAISKPSLGKAAFIGDSSPIEDTTPKYRRQDSGGTKSTYPGWTDPGHAAILSVNIINWLANQENYTGFGSTEHPVGTLTPVGMATIEKSDPNNGQPWSQPSGGFQPWEPATFANGAYAASCPVSGCSTDGDGSTGTALSVTEALALPNGTNVIVEGMVTAELNGIYALLLTNSNDSDITINVKLESSQRNDFSPNLNPAILGQTLRIEGTRDTYLSEPSIESVTSIEIITNSNALSVSEALTELNGTEVIVEGVVTAELNGTYALLLADNTNPSVTINVKLESSQRADFSPNLNPDIIGKTLRIIGVRDTYLSDPSIEYVTEIEIITTDDSTDGNNNTDALSVTETFSLPVGTDVTVEGVVVDELNGIYALLLADSTNSSITINVKLESDQRNNFSPNLNPSILGKTLRITGKRDTYMSGVSVEYITSIEIIN
ncbi:MAG: hypothetical protein OCD00_19240 [Colwellia sp.]